MIGMIWSVQKNAKAAFLAFETGLVVWAASAISAAVVSVTTILGLAGLKCFGAGMVFGMEVALLYGIKVSRKRNRAVIIALEIGLIITGLISGLPDANECEVSDAIL